MTPRAEADIAETIDYLIEQSDPASSPTRQQHADFNNN